MFQCINGNLWTNWKYTAMELWHFATAAKCLFSLWNDYANIPDTIFLMQALPSCSVCRIAGSDAGLRAFGLCFCPCIHQCIQVVSRTPLPVTSLLKTLCLCQLHSSSQLTAFPVRWKNSTFELGLIGLSDQKAAVGFYLHLWRADPQRQQ